MIKFGLLVSMFGDWAGRAVRRSIRHFLIKTSPKMVSAISSGSPVPPGEATRLSFSPAWHVLPTGLSVSPQSAPFFVIDSIGTSRLELLPEGVSADLIEGADLDWPQLSPGSILTITVRNLDKDAPRDFRAAIWGVAL